MQNKSELEEESNTLQKQLVKQPRHDNLSDIEEENNNLKKQQIDIQLQQQIEQKCITSMSLIYPYG